MKTEHESPPPDGVGDAMGMGAAPLERKQISLVRLLERAREQRGSPSLWDAVATRLDSESRKRDVVAPMCRVLDQIRERVDDETWRLVLDFEWRTYQEVMAGIEVGLELGYNHGRTAGLMGAEHVAEDSNNVLAGRIADVLGDTEAEPFDVIIALLSSLRSMVVAARGSMAGRQVFAATRG